MSNWQATYDFHKKKTIKSNWLINITNCRTFEKNKKKDLLRLDLAKFFLGLMLWYFYYKFTLNYSLKRPRVDVFPRQIHHLKCHRNHIFFVIFLEIIRNNKLRKENWWRQIQRLSAHFLNNFSILVIFLIKIIEIDEFNAVMCSMPGDTTLKVYKIWKFLYGVVCKWRQIRGKSLWLFSIFWFKKKTLK